ncbi:uncharacterized protein KY384_006741 [Bacidia gigantensis]|uniref:uncharacterized protein n=1 Tax=Bacidia gigantensis TaxID=2732470 RepID=UPI001D03E9F8|nr:uncharacterized protein KY384_006741 [Bacidia gigantensis]KAG8528569.1 hypothetical protein KY384_006741 [Bacidia gigantensis]
MFAQKKDKENPTKRYYCRLPGILLHGSEMESKSRTGTTISSSRTRMLGPEIDPRVTEQAYNRESLGRDLKVWDFGQLKSASIETGNENDENTSMEGAKAPKEESGKAKTKLFTQTQPPAQLPSGRDLLQRSANPSLVAQSKRQLISEEDVAARSGRQPKRQSESVLDNPVRKRRREEFKEKDDFLFKSIMGETSSAVAEDGPDYDIRTRKSTRQPQAVSKQSVPKHAPVSDTVDYLDMDWKGDEDEEYENDSFVAPDEEPQETLVRVTTLPEAEWIQMSEQVGQLEAKVRSADASMLAAEGKWVRITRVLERIHHNSEMTLRFAFELLKKSHVNHDQAEKTLIALNNRFVGTIDTIKTVMPESYRRITTHADNGTVAQSFKDWVGDRSNTSKLLESGDVQLDRGGTAVTEEEQETEAA